jgi:hypothetical protein
MHHSSIFSFKIFIFKCIFILLLSFFSTVIVFQIYTPLDLASGNKTDKNITRIFVNNYIKELPKLIKVQNNNIGYLGENYSDTIKRVKVLFLGSSTTQSLYVPYDYKWTTLAIDKSKIWSNNCGADGSRIVQWIAEIKNFHSIKPNFIVVLVNPFTAKNLNDKSSESLLKRGLNKISFYKYILRPFVLSRLKRNLIVGHNVVKWEKQIKSNPSNKYESFDINKTKEKLDELISSIKDCGAIPIIISHPTVFGKYIDVHGNDFSKIDESVSIDLFYLEFSNYLFSYCKKEKIPFINGYQLRKNSDYFYDYSHFSLKGSSEFANLIRFKLNNIIVNN